MEILDAHQHLGVIADFVKGDAREASGEGAEKAQIVEHGQFIQLPGSVAYFLPGEIHDTLNTQEEGRSVVVRLESQKLDRVTRFQYNPETGTMKVMDR